MSETNNLDKQIEITRKTTEELKAQLKNLIELRNTNRNTDEKENKNLPLRVQTDKFKDVTSSKYSKVNLEKQNNCALNQNVCSPKKVRSYDVHEAREYIRKQREKRSLQHKSTEAKLKEEIKKEKLQKLHEKAQELVLKNVQTSRQRSKSREKEQYIRIDGSNHLKNISFTKERCTKKNQEKQQIQEKIKSNPTVLSLRQVQEKLPLPKSPNVSSVPSVENIGNKTRNKRFSQDVEARCVEKLNSDFNLAREGDSTLERDYYNGSVHLSKRDQAKKINILSNITVQSGTLPNNPLENQADENFHSNRILSSKLKSQKGICSRDSKGVHLSNTGKEYPLWLQDVQEEGHPLNFINTVKRKLQYAVSLPKSKTDIGIQSSLLENNKYDFADVPNCFQDLNESISSGKNNNDGSNKSFCSHQHNNLDIKSVKHLELIPKSKQEMKQQPNYQNSSVRINSKTDESESDTSKNIPEISSESGTSLRKNAESVKRNLSMEFNLTIDSEKMNQMKLVPQINSATTIQSENPKTSSHIPLDNSNQTMKNKTDVASHISENIYDFDFESDEVYSSPCLSKSRDSILSFNSPEYNEQKLVLPFPQKDRHLSTKSTVNSPSSTHSSQTIPVPLSTNEKIPLKTNIMVATAKSQHSVHSNNKIPISSSPNDQSPLKTEYSQKIQQNSWNIPDIIVTQNIVDTKTGSMNSIISSINDEIIDNGSSNSQKVTNESQSSQIELSQINLSQQRINTRRGSGKSIDRTSVEILPLEEPKSFLFNNFDSNNENQIKLKHNQDKSNLLKNISVRSRNLNNNETEKTNEIHLKFEAEIHLLNDFNQSLRQFSAVEKVVESLKSKKEMPDSNILQNKDTQTSAASKSSTATKSTTKIGENERKSNKSKTDISSINFSRGSHLENISFDNILENSILKLQGESEKSQMSPGLNILQMNSNNKTFFENNIQNLPNCENIPNTHFGGFSLSMFDQLIKDEDARLEHLKMILKIREKALLDRVRAELAWLEIQRKHYKETGNLQEVSAIKKKQRGILLNHQREKHEMQRVKQMQRAASVERKTILKEQRNLIRKQLSTDNMLGKMKVNTPRKRTSSGPLKVIQSHTESIMSETSLSRKSSTEREEVYSVTSHHTVSRVSEISEVEITIPKNYPADMEALKRQQHIKKTLLMREAALRKRRKEAEELLQWNQKLLEEEKRINELELKASSIIRQQHNTTTVPKEKYIFNGKQLNKLWYNVTGCEENKFTDQKVYRMSQIALERFCKSAREYSVKTKKLLSKSSNSDYSVGDISVSENVLKSAQTSSVPSESVQQQPTDLKERSLNNVSVKDYTSDFEVDTTDNVVDVEDIDVNENIDELIHNFSRIEDDISSLGSKHCRSSLAIEEIKSESPKSNKSESEAEISVIETNRIPKDISLSLIKSTTKSLDKSEILHHSQEIVDDEPLSQNNDKSGTFSTEKSSKNDASLNTDYSNRSAVVSKNYENISSPTNIQDNLNKTKEILLILGECESTIAQKTPEKDQFIFDQQTTVENINTSAEILSTLSQIVELVSNDKSPEDSALINKSEEIVPEKEISVLESLPTDRQENLNTSENILTSAPGQVESNILLEEHCSLVNSFIDLSVKEASVNEPSNDVADEQIELYAVKVSNNSVGKDNKEINLSLNEKEPITQDGSYKDTDIEEDLSVDLESVKKTDEKSVSSLSESRTKVSDTESSKCTNQETKPKSNLIEKEHSEKIVETGTFENDITISKSYSISDHLEASELSIYHSSARHQELPSESQEDESNSKIKETIAQQISVNDPNTIENETENIHEKSEISRKSNSTIQTECNEVQNECYSPNKSDSEKINEIPSISNTSQSILNDYKNLQQENLVPKDIDTSNTSSDTSSKADIDVKKRVSEIMAEANQVSKGGDKSPRLQDFYTTTYDLMSPTISPQSESPVDEQLKIAALSSIFDNEAEEILKKQLAIEQEIKQITEQQQKQQMPYMYMREIPNKPPPPYTPPSSLSSTVTSVAVIPTQEEIVEIAKYSAKILHKAYLSNNLENISVSDNTLKLIAKDIPKEKYKFVFDLCKDLSKDHYKQFDVEKCPSWMQVCKKSQLIVKKPFEVNELEKYITIKLKEVFGYEKTHKRENSIIKWSMKKRDHVDEILVVECQAEEDQWINYEKDELIVINEITNDIMDSLLKETADVFSKILSKPLQ